MLVNNCCQLNLRKICIAGTGMGGKQHARISPEPTDGSCCCGGARWWLGDAVLYCCSLWEPSRDGAAEPPEMGILAGLSLKRDFVSLWGKICHWWRERCRINSSGPLDLTGTSLPVPSADLPSHPVDGCSQGGQPRLGTLPRPRASRCSFQKVSFQRTAPSFPVFPLVPFRCWNTLCLCRPAEHRL